MLVTGGAGFIGHNLVKALISDQHQVNILDITTSEDSRVKALIKMGASYYQGDIRILAQSLEQVRLYSYRSSRRSNMVPASVENPTLNDEINIIGTRNIIDFINSHDIKKIVSASSAAVYGNCDQIPLAEESAGDCLSPYAESKFQNEADLFNLVNDSTGVHVLRFFNVYGPGQGTDSNYAAVIPSFVEKIISGQSPTIFGDGSQSRDFVEVSDVVGLILQILADENDVQNDVYNVATQTETSILELLQLISKSVKEIDPSIPIPKVNYQGKRSGDIDISLANIAKVKSAFNWQPKQSIEAGIASLVGHELGS